MRTGARPIIDVQGIETFPWHWSHCFVRAGPRNNFDANENATFPQ